MTAPSYLDTSIGALNHQARGAARHLRDRLADDPAGLEALAALVKEAHDWKDHWAQVTVDKGNSVREASRLALDCEHHGTVIAGLEEQVDHYAEQSDRNNRARLVLVSALQEIARFCDGYDLAVSLGRDVPDTRTVVDKFRAAVAKAFRAHQRVWKT